MNQESRDANSLLVELDRGLQSQNISDQCEAIARFTNLFQKYPLPVLIDSACLKLSEAFKSGSNFVRVQVCDTLGQNKAHLIKIYSVDVFYRNLFTVTTSNDPIARSISLMALGNIATVVSDNRAIHHLISSSLDSDVECELNASLACASSFAKQSSEFACNIYSKIISLFETEDLPIQTKMRALSVLDHGFYNVNDAAIVRAFLDSVAEHSKLKKLTCSCMTLSTKIAYTSLSNINHHISSLVWKFSNDHRTMIKLNALRNLKFLAEKCPHIWLSDDVSKLISYIESNSDRTDQKTIELYMRLILSLFGKLLTCRCNFIQQKEKDRIFKECHRLAHLKHNPALCSTAFELMAVISEEQTFHSSDQSNEERTKELSNKMLASVKAFLTDPPQTGSKRGRQHTKSKIEPIVSNRSSKSIYRQIVKLCDTNHEYRPDLIKMLFDKLNAKETQPSEVNPFMTELLCAIHQSTKEIVITPENCWKLIKTRSQGISETNLLNVCIIYFQTLVLKPNQIVGDAFVDKVIKDRTTLFGFRVLRQAMRYGHYSLAGCVCAELYDQVCTDTLDFYFKSLSRICTAESLIMYGDDIETSLKLALPIYEDAMSPLRASITNAQISNFQLQFLWLRIRTLQAHQAIRQCCKVYVKSPITYTELLTCINTAKAIGEAGFCNLGLIEQLPKLAKDFRHLVESYENLSLISFDCDNRTLDYIDLLKSSCLIMADLIDSIFQYGRNLPVIQGVEFSSGCSEVALEQRKLKELCDELIRNLQIHVIEPGLSASDKTIEPHIDILKDFSNRLLGCLFVYPRYFFQPTQTTQIKLAITPQPSSTSGSIANMLNYNLVLRVEGLIHSTSKTSHMIRKISEVVVTVSVNAINYHESNTTKPSNNYFKDEFLIPMKIAGNFNADIGISVIDERERLWKTGPVERLPLTVS